MLWIYSENDHWFPPEMAHKFDEAFRTGGGVDQFVMVPPYRDDGHGYYYDICGLDAGGGGFSARRMILLAQTELLPAPPVPNVAAASGFDG